MLLQQPWEMKPLGLNSALAFIAAILISASALPAQQSFAERFTAHNTTMTAFQPALITPLVGADPRLIQYARFSVAHQYTPAGTETISYGNNRGGGIFIGKRFEFDVLPPPYIVHNSSAQDGIGDTATVLKYRIASGNAENGNFDIAASIGHCFATGSHKNGAASNSFTPTLIGAYAFHRFDVISSIGGTLPTSKTDTQGRSIAWTALAQAHATRHVWFEVENNATYYIGGIRDGKMQNFITPAAFYVVRPKEWKATHPYFIIDVGMQIATSSFHTYNHNLISETRIIF